MAEHDRLPWYHVLWRVLLVLVLTAGLTVPLYYALALAADTEPLPPPPPLPPSAQPPIAPSPLAPPPSSPPPSPLRADQLSWLWTAHIYVVAVTLPAGIVVGLLALVAVVGVFLVAAILFFILVERSLASTKNAMLSNSDWRHGNFCQQLGFLLCGGKLAFERGAVVEVSVTNGRVLARKDRSKTGVWYNVVWCDEKGAAKTEFAPSDGTYTIKYDDDIVDDSGDYKIVTIETWANRDSSGTRFPPSQMPSEKAHFLNPKVLPVTAAFDPPSAQKTTRGLGWWELVSHLLWQAVRSLHDKSARAVWWLCAAVTLLFPFPWSAAFLPGFFVRFVYGPWAKLLRGGQLRDVIAQDKVAKKIAEDLRAGGHLISRREFWKAVFENRELMKMEEVKKEEAEAVYDLFEKVDNTGDEPQVRLTTLIAQLRRLPDRSCGGALRKGLLRVYRWRTTRLLLSFGYAVNAAWLICALRVVRSAHATDLGALLTLALAWSEAELWELMLGGWALVMSLLWLANALSSADDGDGDAPSSRQSLDRALLGLFFVDPTSMAKTEGSRWVEKHAAAGKEGSTYVWSYAVLATGGALLVWSVKTSLVDAANYREVVCSTAVGGYENIVGEWQSALQTAAALPASAAAAAAAAGGDGGHVRRAGAVHVPVERRRLLLRARVVARAAPDARLCDREHLALPRLRDLRLVRRAVHAVVGHPQRPGVRPEDGGAAAARLADARRRGGPRVGRRRHAVRLGGERRDRHVGRQVGQARRLAAVGAAAEGDGDGGPPEGRTRRHLRRRPPAPRRLEAAQGAAAAVAAGGADGARRGRARARRRRRRCAGCRAPTSAASRAGARRRARPTRSAAG